MLALLVVLVFVAWHFSSVIGGIFLVIWLIGFGLGRGEGAGGHAFYWFAAADEAQAPRTWGAHGQRVGLPGFFWPIGPPPVAQGVSFMPSRRATEASIGIDDEPTVVVKGVTDLAVHASGDP